MFWLTMSETGHRFYVSPKAERAQPQDWCLADTDYRKQTIAAMEFVVHDMSSAGERPPRSRSHVCAGDDRKWCCVNLG